MNIEMFVKIESTEDRVREYISEDMHIPRQGNRPLISLILTIWEAAKERIATRRKEEAEQRVGGLPKTLTKSKHIELHRAYAVAHELLEDDQIPAPSFMEWRLDQIEDGELVAETLDLVISKEEAPEDEWGCAMIMPGGGLRTQKKRQKGRNPTDSEELRQKYRLMATH